MGETLIFPACSFFFLPSQRVTGAGLLGWIASNVWTAERLDPSVCSDSKVRGEPMTPGSTKRNIIVETEYEVKIII